MDEYFETKKKIEEQKIEVNKMTERFKELKSLVYDYKNEKEKEIMNLKDDQEKVKNQIDSHIINYENWVDRATLEIESFSKKNEIDTKVQ